MSDAPEEITYEQARGDIRFFAIEKPIHNAIGFGFICKARNGYDYAADFSDLKFKKIDFSSSTLSHSIQDIEVNVDLIDRSVDRLVYATGRNDIYQISENERKSTAAHIADLQNEIKNLRQINADLMDRIAKPV